VWNKRLGPHSLDEKGEMGSAVREGFASATRGCREDTGGISRSRGRAKVDAQVGWSDDRGSGV